MIIYNRCREEQAFRGRLAVERYEIDGGRPLVGEVSIQGSKNAVLPMMAAAVLHQGTVVLEHCPVISDVQCMVRILEKLGCTVNWEGHTLIIDAQEIRSVTVPEKEAKRMRSSVMLLGALLGRKGKAQGYAIPAAVSLAGGHRPASVGAGADGRSGHPGR